MYALKKEELKVEEIEMLNGSPYNEHFSVHL